MFHPLLSAPREACAQRILQAARATLDASGVRQAERDALIGTTYAGTIAWRQAAMAISLSAASGTELEVYEGDFGTELAISLLEYEA